MIYLKSFKLSPHRNANPNAYPYNIFGKYRGDVFIFDKITVLYGNNGSGKSTLLNLIANKLNIQGYEDIISSDFSYYTRNYAAECTYSMGDSGNEGETDQLPQQSMYIKSEDILYEIKKIQQEGVLREGYVYQHAKLGYTKEQLEELKQSEQMRRQIAIMKFANEKYSNGETSMQIFDEYLVPGALFLLDEPETSLSPNNQIRLAEEINRLARFLDCQFIIATHSPFLLGTLGAKIYNLDSPQLRICQWHELDNIRFFHQFFKAHEREFE